MNEINPLINRRGFLRQGARGTSALVLGGMALKGAWPALAGKAQQEPNPFAYEIERLAKTDPKLIQYEEVARFRSPHPEPRRVVCDSRDRLYLATGNGIVVLDAQGNLLHELSPGVAVRCVAVDTDGTVYAGVRDHIEVFDSKGQARASWSAPGKRAWLTGLAVGRTEIFAADSGDRALWRYDKAGQVLGRLAVKDQARNVPGLIVPSPYLDIDLGADGLLRLNNPGRHCVEVYTVEGDLEFSWGKPSAAIHGFCGCCNPIGLALLPDGRCVTCEKGLPRVKVYSSHGEFECVVAGPESFSQTARAGSPPKRSDGTTGGLDAAVDSQGRIYILDLIAADVRVMRRKNA